MSNEEKDLVKRIARLMEENKELSIVNKKLSTKNDSLQEKVDQLKTELEEAKATGGTAAGKSREKTLRFKMATILFADIEGFGKLYEASNSHDIIDELDNIFFEFDQISEKYNIQKIKTIGDTYMSAGGVPIKNITNPIDVVMAALEMQHKLNKIQEERLQNNKKIWDIKLGMHTGPVTATTMGRKKVSYNLKGDTVNIASRMKASCEKGKINISVMTYEMVREYFNCEYFGKMPVKYKGDMDMYYVKGIRSELAADEVGLKPNHQFIIRYLLRQFSDLQEIVLDILEKGLPEYLYYHNVKHTIDVTSQAELIGIGEGVNDEEMLLLKTAGLFHDAGHTIGYEEHEYYGTQMARKMLPDFHYTQEQIDQICELVMATKLPPQPKTRLEKIMCDADLDYLGRSDFIPVSNTLYKELNAQNKIGDLDSWNKLQVKFISLHQYFTQTANNLREVNKQKQIERIKHLLPKE
ncbi:MAG: HD domain-containing protein [Salinivirgaceae bacterium]|jgi:adenylate cyclase|nr:HD domain-containing protein [Salinivirgaceae bacterium]